MKFAVALYLLVVFAALPVGGASDPGPLLDLPPLSKPTPPHSVPWRYAEMVYLECQAEDVPYWLAARLFDWESGFIPSKIHINPDGSIDVGIAMANSVYHGYFSEIYNNGKPIDFYNGFESIRFGVQYLSDLIGATGSLEDSVAAYNCGLGRWLTGLIPRSTERHVVAVMGYTSPGERR